LRFGVEVSRILDFGVFVVWGIGFGVWGLRFWVWSSGNHHDCAEKRAQRLRRIHHLNPGIHSIPINFDPHFLIVIGRRLIRLELNLIRADYSFTSPNSFKFNCVP